ncbi:hypothetical protein ACQY0O_004471 [Thecaphora frezii]
MLATTLQSISVLPPRAAISSPRAMTFPTHPYSPLTSSAPSSSSRGVRMNPHFLEAMYEWPGWATSKARRFYNEEWQRMDGGTADQRPPYPYAEIIKVAMLKSPHRRLTLSQLYADCSSKFPYFASLGTSDSWKNTLRHNLSTQRYFVKLNREVSQPGKGHYWTYDAHIELAGMSPRKRRQIGARQYGCSLPRLGGRYSHNNLSRPRSEPSSPFAETVYRGNQLEALISDRRQSLADRLVPRALPPPLGGSHIFGSGARGHAGVDGIIRLPDPRPNNSFATSETLLSSPPADVEGESTVPPKRSLSDLFLSHPIAGRGMSMPSSLASIPPRSGHPC